MTKEQLINIIIKFWHRSCIFWTPIYVGWW